MTSRRVVPANRRMLATLIVGCAVVVVVLGSRYADASRPGRIDRFIDRRLRYRFGTHLRLLNHVVDLGDPASIVTLCAVLVLGFVLARRYRLAILAALGPAVAAGLTEFVLKPTFGRRLDGYLSFPSGHTTGTVAVAVVVVVFLLGPSKPRLALVWRALLAAAAIAEALAVATALIGAGYHYATDTVGGCCVSIATIIALGWTIDVIADARARYS